MECFTCEEALRPDQPYAIVRMVIPAAFNDGAGLEGDGQEASEETFFGSVICLAAFVKEVCEMHAMRGLLGEPGAMN